MPAPHLPPSAPWPAFAAARARDGRDRIPFVLAPEVSPTGAAHPLGTVARDDLDALAAWPDAFRIDAASGALMLLLPADRRDDRLDAIHRALHAAGRLRGWRDEPYPLRDPHGGEHGRIERAASRFWGLLTLGAHLNGYLADDSGRPTHLWIARRSPTKPTDPGRLDNLVGGGVPAGQTPDETIVREGAEEAGLAPHEMVGRVPGGCLLIDADVPEGRQLERLHVYDLRLPPAWRPRAVDGEVAEHLLCPLEETIARAAAGELTTDATLATLDFLLRHDLCGQDTARLARALDRLRVDRPSFETDEPRRQPR